MIEGSDPGYPPHMDWSPVINSSSTGVPLQQNQNEIFPKQKILKTDSAQWLTGLRGARARFMYRWLCVQRRQP